jgi:hypothetical protein
MTRPTTSTRPVRPTAPIDSAVSHMVRLPVGTDSRIFGGWGIKL